MKKTDEKMPSGAETKLTGEERVPEKTAQELASEIGERDGLKEELLRMCRQNHVAALSAAVILIIILLAVFAPVIAPYKEAEQDLMSRLQGPSMAHLFGTDELGRDVFSRILYGARVSLIVGIFPSIISLVIGIVMGKSSGSASSRSSSRPSISSRNSS